MARPPSGPTPPAGQHGLEREDLPDNASAGETAGAPPHDSGDTATIRNEQPSHRLPHERDESTSSQEGGASGIGRTAHGDASQGVPDTSRSEETDDTYGREFRGDRSQTPPPRRAPPGSRH